MGETPKPPAQPVKGALDVTITLGPGGRVTQVKTGRETGLPTALPACVVPRVQGARFDAPKGGTVKVTLNFDARLVAPPVMPRRPRPVNPYGFVLTRLHARYGKDALGQDLVFREVGPIEGGREAQGVPHQEHGARPSSVNNFQARYAIRHPWTGPIKCANPQRGIWGSPPPGVQGDTSAKPALKVAFAPRGQVDLAGFLRDGVPELKIAAPDPATAPVEPGARGCGACAVGGDDRGRAGGVLAALAALVIPLVRRRRRR